MPKPVAQQVRVRDTRTPQPTEPLGGTPGPVVTTNGVLDGECLSALSDGLRYVAKDHEDMPHVVRFSGGRSSGMLLFALLENGILQAERGDVVVFNNTSAEHPETYRFAGKCKRIVEEEHGIPFFWVEFQTYEDARHGEWTRLPTYRLVTSEPRSDDRPDGHSWRGEAFEEMLSWAGYVPNQFSRTCTRSLKLEVTRQFLRDWLACKEGVPRQGHHGAGSRMDDDTIIWRHNRNGGGVPSEILLKKKEYVRGRPVFRPAQRFGDFSAAFRAFDNPTLAGKRHGDTVQLGEDDAQYVSFIGLRHDERHRVDRVRKRNRGAEEENGHDGEHVYMPLDEHKVTRETVDGFWRSKGWGLDLPFDANLSNCVYCFLKGVGNLQGVRAHMAAAETDEALRGTPSDIGWWHRVEELYGRDLVAEKRNPEESLMCKTIGFFGMSGLSYERLASRDPGEGPPPELADAPMPCDCTD